MSYRSYDAVDFNATRMDELAERVEGQWTIVAHDAAKHWQYAKVFTVDRQASAPGELLCEEEVFRWKHPSQTAEVMDMLAGWSADKLEVVMEPSGVYPAGWVESLKSMDEVEVVRMRGKKTRDSKENYDNVPSMHDAKAADVIARVHLGGGGQPWNDRTRRQRELKAAIKDLDRLKDERQSNRGRLEAEVARWWPELSEELALDSTTLLELLAQFGAPEQLVQQPDRGREVMREASRGQLGAERRQRILQQAADSVGCEPIDEEIRYVKKLARRQLELKEQIREGERRIEQLQDGYEVAEQIGDFAGPLVGAVLPAEVGDPHDFHCASAYEKAAGLNLVEDTSGGQGQHTDQDETPRMRISKRGSSRARKQLYLAVQRWIQWDPAARAWYQHKVDQHAGCEGAETLSLVALMRKLIKLLYHLGQGAEYKPSELFDLERLRRRGYDPDTPVSADDR